MSETIYSFTQQELTDNSNRVKNAFIGMMVAEEFITEEQGQELEEKYAVVLHKKNYFGQIIDKILFKNYDDKATIITVVKICDKA